MSEQTKRRLGISIAGILVLALVAVGAFLLLSGGSANAKQIATLRLFGGTVEVQSATADFTIGTEGQALHEGDTVRTGSDGRASIEYFDGSLTRMDFDTTFTLTTLQTLDNAAGSKVIEGEQTSGNTYNRVAELTDSASRFDIETPTATASVQGTVYAIILNPDGSTSIAVIEGVVTATGSAGAKDVTAGMMATIGLDGTVGDLVPIPDDLLNSDWFTFNQCDLDQIRDCVLGEAITGPTGDSGPTGPTGPTSPPAPTGTGGTGGTTGGDGGTPPEPVNQDPSAGFVLAPGNGPAPHTVSVADASSDPDGDALTRHWAFGDGSSHEGGQNLTHTYSEPGDYFLTLTVTDPFGASDSVKALVHVTDGTAPVVEITGGPDDPSDSADAFFSFTSSEAGTGFSCSLDGEPAGGCGASASLMRDLMARLAGGQPSVSGSASYSGLGDGPHSFAVSVTDLAGNIGSASFDWTVDAVADLDHITLSPSASTIEVGQPQPYSVTAFDENGNSMGNVTGSSTISGIGCSGSACSPGAAGDYTITATYQGKIATAQLHVLQPAPEEAVFDHILVQPGSATITYGESQTYTALAVDTDGASMGDVTADTIFAGATCTGNVCTPQTAGSHLVTGSYSGVLGSDSDAATLDVNPATLTVTAAAKSRQYGVADPAFTFAYSGFVLGDDAGDLTTEPACSSSASATSNVGGYPITCSGGADDNYSFDYHNASLTITKAPVVITADDKSKTFGSADPAFTFGASGLKNGESLAVFDTQPTCGVSGAHGDIGTYAIVCSGGSDNNYSFSFQSGTLTVGTKATLTVAAQNKTIAYGDAEPTFTFTYSGFVNGDTAAVIDTPPTCSVSGAHANAGTYTIACSGGSDNNYAFSYVSGTLAITKVGLTVTPSDVTVTEGQTPTYPFAITGFANGETQSVIDALPTCTAGAGPFAVGTYPITCSGGSDNNYDFTSYNTATLTVNAESFHLVYKKQPDPKTNGTVTAQVEVQNSSNVKVNSTATVTLSFATEPDNGASLCGNVVTSANGIANFNNIAITQAGTYTLVATADGIASATSSSFTVTVPGTCGTAPVTRMGSAASSGSSIGRTAGAADRSRGGGYVALGLMVPMAFGALRRRHRR